MLFIFPDQLEHFSLNMVSIHAGINDVRQTNVHLTSIPECPGT